MRTYRRNATTRNGRANKLATDVMDARTPCELVDAYEDYIGGGTQYLDAETGLKAKAYLFSTHVLLVYEESETGVVVLINPTSSGHPGSSW
jgi:hypothetical protein